MKTWFKWVWVCLGLLFAIASWNSINPSISPTAVCIVLYYLAWIVELLHDQRKK